MLFDGKLLDGRNRVRACRQGGRAIRTIDYACEDPLGFVLSSNLHRRYLVDSQRAMVAARLAQLCLSANQHAQICAPSQPEAAKALNVSRRAVQQARVVQEKAAPLLAQRVMVADATQSGK